MIFLIQSDVAERLLSKQDVTVIGLSLAFIVILLVIITKLWKAKQESDQYIREQDKANLQVLNALANSLNGVETKVEKGNDKIDDVSSQISTLRGDLLNKLNS